MIPPDPAWQRALRAASVRDTEDMERTFLALVNKAEGRICPETARALLATFSAKPDFGTQESVCRVLASGNDRIVAEAILEELPRLVKEAPEWAESLLGPEVEFRPLLIAAVIKSAGADAREAALALLKEPHFAEFHSNAEDVLSNVAA